jgi:hypothetical protein
MNRNLLLPFVVASALCLAISAQTGTQSQTGTSQTGASPSTGMQQPSAGTQSTSPGMQQSTSPASGSTTQRGTSQGMSQNGGGTEQQILALEEQLRQSVERNDPSFIQQHSTDNYVSIGGQGTMMPKSQVVQAMKAGDIHYQSIELIGTPTVRLFGDTAIVNGEAQVRLTRYGQPVSGKFRYTRVWVNQNGEWKMASFEATPEEPQAK